MPDKRKKSAEKKKQGLKRKIPRTMQQTIPYQAVYPNGVILVEPGLYAKSYFFDNMNFATENEERQEELLKCFGKLINKFNHNITCQFTIFNRKTSQENVEERFFIRPKADGLQEYRDEYNRILSERIKEGRNDIRKERYLTIGLHATDVVSAMNTYATLDIEVNEAVKDINRSGVRPLTIEERLCILHDIFHADNENHFSRVITQYRGEDGEFSLAKLNKTGMTTKDLVGPDVFVNETAKNDVRLAENLIAKSFIISNLPYSMDTSFLTEISNIPCAMLTNVIFRTVERREATKMVNERNNSLKSGIVKETNRAIKNHYDPSLMSESLITAKEEATYLLKDITINNQKIFFTTITVTLFAETMEEMKEYISILQMRASDFLCQCNALYGQQMPALKTALPLGKSHLAIDRVLTTEGAEVLLPFSIQELMDEQGHFYGLNYITKNMIIYNRRNSALPNGLYFGKSGSGKSFFAKGEIIPNYLDGEDDIIILDPDGEYVAIAQEYGGTVISLSTNADLHINPLDMDINYAAKDNEDPVASKCDYLVSLCESILGKYDPLSSYDINVILKCGRLIYEDYMEHMGKLTASGNPTTCDYDASPTLVTFYSKLLDLDGPEAHRLAMAIEPYAIGNYNTFAHRTNVNAKSRFLVYDLRSMPKKMKEFAMKVCLSDIWNRVVQNHDQNKATWVYLDEFYLLIQTESSAVMLQEYWKRIRKYYGIMTGITQDIEDVLVTPEGRGILNNSGFVVMMNQSQIGRAELREQYNLSPALMEYIKDKPPGIGLLYNGQSVVPFNYKLPVNTKLYKLMSTKPGE